MTDSARTTLLQILNLAAVVGAITVNALANLLPLNDRNTGELSALYPNLFVPAGLTFSIWGLIYLLWIVFAIYQARTLFSARKDAFVDRIGPWFFLSGVANAGWLFAWHYERVGLSVLVMLVLLGSLLAVYVRLGIGVEPEAPRGERLFVHLPMQVYLGWITVATIANVTAFLVAVGWDGFGLSDQSWTILLVAVATAITVFMLRTRGDVPFALVVLWAFVGIVLRRLEVDPVPLYPLLLTLAGAMAVILGTIVVQVAGGRGSRRT